MLASLFALAVAAAPPRSRSPEIGDADTRAWWQATEALSGDDMDGRDTGSPGYDRAARLVAERFGKAGLRPAGTGGSWFQALKLDDLRITTASLRVGDAPLRLLHDVTVRPSAGMPRTVSAALVFRGYCAPEALGDVRGKVVLCYGWRRSGLTSAAQRSDAVEQAGAAGMITIADPGFTVEPMRWPAAYARTMSPVGAKPVAGDRMLVATLNPAALERVIAGSSVRAADLLASGSAGKPLANFDIPGRLQASFTVHQSTATSSNVLGVLPGTDPRLKGQYVVVSAHLDGYGHGEPVAGDGLYNGTLDDAAYVALLQRLAERRHGKGFRRSVIFAAFTGEEKGLLGANAFVAAPTVPLASIVADINLDQLRPIFPLDLMTVHAVDDSTLGDAARQVAGGMDIAVQVDPEPERNLLRRADHWPFIQAGIPATGFVFGYRAGTDSERKYREWYEKRYHKPQDDLTQPMNWAAAAKFNSFFYALVASVADAEAPPKWKPSSQYATRER